MLILCVQYGENKKSYLNYLCIFNVETTRNTLLFFQFLPCKRRRNL